MSIPDPYHLTPQLLASQSRPTAADEAPAAPPAVPAATASQEGVAARVWSQGREEAAAAALLSAGRSPTPPPTRRGPSSQGGARPNISPLASRGRRSGEPGEVAGQADASLPATLAVAPAAPAPVPVPVLALVGSTLSASGGSIRPEVIAGQDVKRPPTSRRLPTQTSWESESSGGGLSEGGAGPAAGPGILAAAAQVDIRAHALTPKSSAGGAEDAIDEGAASAPVPPGEAAPVVAIPAAAVEAVPMGTAAPTPALLVTTAPVPGPEPSQPVSPRPQPTTASTPQPPRSALSASMVLPCTASPLGSVILRPADSPGVRASSASLSQALSGYKAHMRMTGASPLKLGVSPWQATLSPERVEAMKSMARQKGLLGHSAGGTGGEP